MKPDERIVAIIPLTELWDDTGTLTGKRIRDLDLSNVLELLRVNSAQFVVADCGLKLRWILEALVRDCVVETGRGPWIIFDSWASLLKPGEGGEA